MVDDNKLISDEDIAKIEAEIKSKQAEELKRMSEVQAKEIEDRIRKEMSERVEKENMIKKLEELENLNKKAKDEMELKLKLERESFEKRLVELESQKRGLSRSESPFNQPVPTNVKMINGVSVDLDKLDYDRIEEESRLKWMEFVGIKNPDWGKDYGK